MFHTHNFVTHHVPHTTLSHTIFHTQLCHTPSFTDNFVTHHVSLPHTIFHIQLCHTPSFTHNFVTLSLSHTILSHTIFHTQLGHTPFFTHNFVTHHVSHTQLCHTPCSTHNFVTHHLSHTILSHTIFHTQLCHTPCFFATHSFVTHHVSLSHTIFHTQLCHTPSFTHNFVTHHLSHTTLHIQMVHTQLTHTQLAHTHHILCFSFLPRPATTFVAHYWKKLTCGVIRPFTFSRTSMIHRNFLRLDKIHLLCFAATMPGRKRCELKLLRGRFNHGSWLTQGQANRSAWLSLEWKVIHPRVAGIPWPGPISTVKYYELAYIFVPCLGNFGKNWGPLVPLISMGRFCGFGGLRVLWQTADAQMGVVVHLTWKHSNGNSIILVTEFSGPWAK